MKSIKHIGLPALLIILLLLASCEFLLPIKEKDYFLDKNNLIFKNFTPNNQSVGQYITLSWDSNPELQLFHLQVCDSESFSENLLVNNDALTENSYSTILEPGVYYWRARFYFDGHWEAWTDAMVIEVTTMPVFGYTDLDFENQAPADYVEYQWERSGDILPFLQSEVVYSGSSALCFGELESNNESIVELTLELTEDVILAFKSKVNSRGYLHFYIDYEEGNRSIYSHTNDSWVNYRSSIITAGTHTFRWSFYQDSNQYSGNTAWLDNIVLIPVLSENNCDMGFENLNGTGSEIVTFTYHGDQTPYIQSTTYNQGSNALCFGELELYEESIAELTLELTESSILTFDSMVDSNGSLSFYIDYEEGDNSIYFHSINSWQNYSSPVIPAGTHTFRWRYYQISSQYSGDTAWLDNIVLTTIDAEDNCDLGFENQDGTGPDIVTFNYQGDQVPYIQSITYNQGSNALCFGELERYEESIAELTLELTESSILTFDSMVDSGGDIYFYIDYEEGDNSTYSHSINSWKNYRSSIIPAGSHTFRWRYYQDSSQYPGDTAWLDNIVLAPVDAEDNCDLGFENQDGTGPDIVTFNYQGDQVPYIQSTTYNQGSNALCFGELETSEESIAELTLELTENVTISFDSKVYSYGYLYFYIDYEDGNSSIYSHSNNFWENYCSSIIPAGTHTFRWRYYQDAYQYTGDTAWLDNIVLTPVNTEDNCDLGFENLDGTGPDIVTFNYQGDRVPYIQSTTYNQGSNALCFGELETSEESIAELTLELTENVTLSFNSKVDSYGYLYFYIDYEEGNSSNYSHSSNFWENYSSSIIPAGTHTFRWRYYQDAYQYTGDTAWLDNIVLTPVNTEDNCDLGFENLDGTGPDIVTFNYLGDRVPYIQSTTYNQGSNALCFGELETSEESIAELTLELTESSVLTFDSMVDSYGSLYFFIDYEEGDSSIYYHSNNSWENYRSSIIPSGTHTFRWRYYQDSYQYPGNTAWLDNIAITPVNLEDNCDLGFENLDGTGPDIVTFNYLGDRVPYIQSAIYNQGSYALCFDELERNEESIAEMTLELTESTIITFDSMVDSYGSLHFYIDYEEGDSSIYSHSYNSWENYSSSIIPAGTHTFRWRYYQNSSQYPGDTAWLDNIVLTPVNTEDNCDLGFENLDGTGPDIVTFNYQGDRAPYIQSAIYNQGSYALCFDELERNEESIAEMTLVLTDDSVIAFESKVDSYGYLYFYIDYEEGDSCIYSHSYNSWQNYCSPVIPAGTHTFRWRYYQDSYQYPGDTAWLDDISISPVSIVTSIDFEQSDAMDAFTLTGAISPAMQSDRINSGSGALKFGTITHGQSSTAELEITTTSAATMSFAYSVSSETDRDRMLFKVDGNTVLIRSGEIDWTLFNYTFPSAGTFILTWTYTKDNMLSIGSDTAWLDDIIIYE